jgi:DnaJ family protein A protein 5
LKKIADLRRQMLLEDEQDLSPVTLSSDIAVNSDDDSNEVFTDARQAIDASDGDCKDDLDEISKRFGGSVDINNSNESINNQPHNKHPFDDGSDVVFDSDKESPPAIVGNEATSKDKKQRKPRRAKNKQQDATELPPMRCNVCNEEFPTRNKLFQHISTTGHALAADQNSGKQKSKKTKRK